MVDPSQLYVVGSVFGTAEGASVRIAVGIADEATVGIALGDALVADTGLTVTTSGQRTASAKYG